MNHDLLKNDIAREDTEVIWEIAHRASALATTVGFPREAWMFAIDIEVCHAHGCKLDLQAMLDGDDGNFGHDVSGIKRYLDHETGQLTDCFVPRFAKGDQS